MAGRMRWCKNQMWMGISCVWTMLVLRIGYKIEKSSRSCHGFLGGILELGVNKRDLTDCLRMRGGSVRASGLESFFFESPGAR